VTDRPHQLLTVVLGDTPGAWRAAGFAVSDAGTLTLGATTILLDGSGRGFVSWLLDGVTAEVDGLPRSPAAAAPGPAVHPNGISSIDHVVVRSGDCDRTVAAFETAGLEVRGGRSTTSYGSPMRQVFLWAGDVIVELVGPGEGEPTTDEPTSIFGLALVSPDIDATAAALGPLLGTAKEAVQPGRLIAGLRGKEVGISVPLAVMTPHPSGD
jgi:hypothetical protein